MTKETKISIGIMIIGLLALGGYWFSPQAPQLSVEKKKSSSKIEERVILPLYEKSIYQNIAEVKSYMSDIQKMIAQGKAVLPLNDTELDVNGRIAQETYFTK